MHGDAQAAWLAHQANARGCHMSPASGHSVPASCSAGRVPVQPTYLMCHLREAGEAEQLPPSRQVSNNTNCRAYPLTLLNYETSLYPPCVSEVCARCCCLLSGMQDRLKRMILLQGIITEERVRSNQQKSHPFAIMREKQHTQGGPTMLADRLCNILIELVGIPSTTGHEEHIRNYLERQLAGRGLSTQVDGMGNLVATLAGTGKPLLLNAHMDRVPPGLGHRPVLRDGILYSDGTTNLGADDAAGIAIILEVLARVVEQQLPHPPLVVVFTVQEEVGTQGSAAFDPSPWQITDGVVF